MAMTLFEAGRALKDPSLAGEAFFDVLTAIAHHGALGARTLPGTCSSGCWTVGTPCQPHCTAWSRDWSGNTGYSLTCAVPWNCH